MERPVGRVVARRSWKRRGVREPGGTNEKRMQPTWRRSAQTGAGHGSPPPASAARSSEFGDVELLRVHLAEDGARVEA